MCIFDIDTNINLEIPPLEVINATLFEELAQQGIYMTGAIGQIVGYDNNEIVVNPINLREPFKTPYLNQLHYSNITIMPYYTQIDIGGLVPRYKFGDFTIPKCDSLYVNDMIFKSNAIDIKNAPRIVFQNCKLYNIEQLVIKWNKVNQQITLINTKYMDGWLMGDKLKINIIGIDPSELVNKQSRYCINIERKQ